ncbi:MAG: glutathione S-transferase family protein [Leptospiraceae bacterium]|nr:glutathione S-transferase family protein [Leptospiraceae bacterium]MDW8305532.1 glutathione S-transferase family protein [Leptospiraceae bacterium]
MAHYKLVSFKLCPFVQRSVIVLKMKKVPFDVIYIDLENKPDWFLKLSPTGKVPLLQVNGEVLFESAIINEYLDETNPPSLHPSDPLERAKNRAWIEFFSQLFSKFYQMCHAKEKSDYETYLGELRQALLRIQKELKLPYFNGPSFSLADAAIAPLFSRLSLLEHILPGFWDSLDEVKSYSANLLSLREVKESVLPDFGEEFCRNLQNKGSFLGLCL